MPLKFRRGEGAIKREQERREDVRKQRMGKLFRFYINKDDSGEEVPIWFLTKEALSFKEHEEYIDGKPLQTTCTEDDDCELCPKGNRATFKSAWLIIDCRKYKTKERKNGKETGKEITKQYTIKPLVRGVTDSLDIIRQLNKYGIDRPYNVIRSGVESSTKYTFDRGESEKLPQAILKTALNNLPEQLQGLSFEQILEAQFDPDFDFDAIKKDTKKKISGGVKSVVKSHKKHVDYDEDEEDVDESEEEDTDDYDDEEEEVPKKHKKVVLNRKKFKRK